MEVCVSVYNGVVSFSMMIIMFVGWSNNIIVYKSHSNNNAFSTMDYKLKVVNL